MPAITRSQIYNNIKTKVPADYSHPNCTELLNAVSDAIGTGWSKFHSALTFGNLTVSGLGTPVWSGKSSGGGVLVVTPWSILIKPLFTDAPDHVTFCNTLSKILNQELNKWAPSFVFTPGVDFLGASTATLSTPGIFNATNTTLPISGAGSGADIIGLQKKIEDELAKSGFIIAKSGISPIIKGIAFAVEDGFKKWLTSPMTSNSVTGTSVAGTGNGVGTSLTNGKLG